MTNESFMGKKSIRFRLTLWYSLALAAALGLFALATWVSMWRSLLGDVDGMLTQRARSVQAFVNAEIADPGVKLPEELDEYSHAFPQDAYIEVRDQNGSLVFTSNGKFPWQPSTALNPRLQRVPWKHHTFRVLSEALIVNGRRWHVEISESLDTTERILSRLRLLLVTLIPAVILIAGFGGQWLSRRALKPVDEITAAARSMSIANLSERLIVPQTGDELQRLSETWNSMLSRLEDAVKRLSRFTADASHELRTPLAVIRTTAEIAVRRSRSEDSYREALRQIITESERMTHLVEDLLFLARCDSEAVELPMSTLELSSIIEHVCSQIRPLAESNGIVFSCRLPRSKVSVLGNELAVRRLVLALLDNAIKYSRTGGEVNVVLRESADELHLEVADSGPGIPESELPRIFQRFYRAPQARDAALTGSGLGLSLAAGIAQHHHARIEVQSVPGKGATFRVLFQPALS